MRDADSMADTGLPVSRRPAGVVSGGRRGRAGQCGGSFGPLCPFPWSPPCSPSWWPPQRCWLWGSGAGRPLAGGADGAAVPGPRCWQCCAGAGVGGGLPHRRQDGSRPLPGKSGLPEEAERLLAFCNNSNPVFLISVLGVGVFGSVRAGGVAVADPCALRPSDGTGVSGQRKTASRQELTRHPPFQAVSFAEAFTGAVRSSLAGILSVCAFVVFFYVLAQPLTAMGGRLGAVLVAALELFSLTPLLTADAFGFLLAAAAAGWGGLSVLCQTLAVLEGSSLRLRNCFLGKVVQSAFSLLLAALLVGYVLG